MGMHSELSFVFVPPKVCLKSFEVLGRLLPFLWIALRTLFFGGEWVGDSRGIASVAVDASAKGSTISLISSSSATTSRLMDNISKSPLTSDNALHWLYTTCCTAEN